MHRRIHNMQGKPVRAAMLIVALTTSAICRGEGPQATIDAIRAAWLKRQDRVKSAVFVWSRSAHVPRGAMNFLRRPDATEDLPPQDILLDTPQNHFSLDACRVSHRTDVLDGMATSSGRTSTPYHSAYDGTASKSLLRSPRLAYAEGCIDRGTAYRDVGNLSFRPLLLNYRALHPNLLAIDLRQYNVDVREVSINGHFCALLRQRQPTHAGVWGVYAVALNSEFEVLRYSEYVDGLPGRLYAQLDVWYQPDAEFGAVPARWRTAFFEGAAGKTGKSFEGRTLEYVFNEPIPSEEFTLPFPVGTLVENERTGERWIELGEGRRRIITEAESRRGATYDELISTEATSAASVFKTGRLLGLLALPVLIVIVVVLKRVHRTLKSRAAARRIE